MPSAAFRPFADIITDDAVTCEPWMLEGSPLGEGAVVPGWNYGTPMRLRRNLRLSPAAIRRDTGLSTGSVVRVASSWQARAAINLGATGPLTNLRLDRSELVEVGLVMDVPSSAVAERVMLSTALVLVRRGENAAPLAAREPGSVLWSDSSSIILEGTRPRMPIITADFGTMPTAESEAAWFVWTRSDWLSRHPSNGIALYLNSARPSLLQALTAGRGPYERALKSVLHHEVGRELIVRALGDDEFSEDAEYSRGTAGHSIRATLRVVFKHQSIAQIRELCRTAPDQFERTLQTRHRLLGELR